MLTRLPFSDEERAFTLVEMIVAMIVLALVMAVIGTALVATFRGGNKSLNERRAMQQVNQTVTKVRSDVARAKAAGRDEGNFTDTGALSKALLAASPPSSIFSRRDGTTGAQIFVDDIVVATPNRLMVRADVLPLAGTECVEYIGVPVTAPTKVDRVVYQNCTTPVLRETLIDRLTVTP